MSMATSIPRIRGLPLIGNLPEFRSDRLNLYLRVARECGDIGGYRVGARQPILINSSELVHAVLVEHAHDFDKGPLFRLLTRPLLGNGLLTIPNEFHKRQRKLVAPAFQHRRIAAYAEVMAHYTERLQSGWPDGARINVAREMMRLTLWIVGKTLFDADVLEEAEELGDALATTLRTFNEQVGAVIPIPMTWPTLRNRRFRAAITRLDATIFRIIAERRASGLDRGDLLSMLLQTTYEDDQSFMTDQQVHDEVKTLFLAGHETTANALAWAWYLLSQHPEVYARLCAEADQVLGGRSPAFDDLPNLPYTLKVLKEAMRLYPPAPTIGRMSVRPVELGGYRLPAGTQVIISPYALHRRPDYFPDPERFDPDRWTPEMEARLPRYAYLPFGGGPRICIGNHFAMMEGQLVLAALARSVVFELIEPQRIVPEPLVTLRPRYGIKMVVRRR